ncbi:MAG: Gfo/Idh/MocA family protein, partial [Isosphaeraceae bacterium]
HGAGWRESLAGLDDEIEIVAFLTGFGGSTTSLEERNAGLPRFETVQDLIQWGDFDGALLCLPNNEVINTGCQLAEAGKAVLIEKPCAASANEWQSLANAIHTKRIAFQAGYMWRYDEGANRLRAMFAEGRFGKPIAIKLHWITSDVARRGPSHYLFDQGISGHGFFNWLACHWIDIVPWLTGQRVTGVMARVGNFGEAAIDVDDGGTVILELENGCQVTITGGYWLPRWAGEAGVSIYGSQRWLHWDPNRAGTAGHFEIHGPQPQFMAMNEDFSLPADSYKGYGGQKTLELIRDWVKSARGGETCRHPPATVREALRVIDAIYESSAEGRLIRLSY